MPGTSDNDMGKRYKKKIIAIGVIRLFGSKAE
jgi:hypothetical protein